MKKSFYSVLAVLMAGSSAAMADNSLYIDSYQRGADINPSMYGIFFEEINHSGDGGLYAELIRNRGFEEHTVPGGFEAVGDNLIQTKEIVRYDDLSRHRITWQWDFAGKKMTGWKVDSRGCAVSYDVTVPAVPLHEATPNAMRIEITGASENSQARLINSGYWGMAVEKDAKYDLRFYLSSADYEGKVTAVIYDKDCTRVLSSVTFDVDSDGEWHEFRSVMTSGSTVNDANFALIFSGGGTVCVDYVSLFPQDTFCGRPNGLRPDLAQFLVDMKPKFMRWPGGCIVEGVVLDNRVRWKETLGDPMTRPGEYDLWGYRSSWGLGYHEVLQFCEDAGMDCMFVGNAGLSCSVRGGEFVAGADVEPFYEEIRDAIEYAIGDPQTNEWAARRAEAGHPSPFPLKYVEIGNENFTERYLDNYNYIYNRLKKEYPQLVFLNTLGIDDARRFGLKTDMIDPHWYVDPDYFYNNRTIFDNVPRGDFDIYVGEYAVNNGVGTGNMDAALSEAVFMMDMERNSDIVKMASYAPLITNDHAPNWTCNLIWQHSGELFGRASYYVQKMFAENLPDYNVMSRFDSDRARIPYEGRVGIGTWTTSAAFRNLKVTDSEGRKLYEADFSGKRQEWTDMQGAWTAVADGTMLQADDTQTRCISLMNRLAFRDCVIEVEARKESGAEGVLLTFGCNDADWDHYYQLNVGGWGNTSVAIEDVSKGVGRVISEQPPFKVENGRWYRLKVVCSNGDITAYVDDVPYCRYSFGTAASGRFGAHAGYDTLSGEFVVKVVNAESDPMEVSINLNASDIASTGTVETLAASGRWDENSFADPEMIVPQKKSLSGFARSMKYAFEPYSVTVLRVKGSPASSPMEIPPVKFSSEPRELEPSTPEQRNLDRLRRLVAEATAVALSDQPGYELLNSATEQARSVLTTGDAASVASAVTALNAALNSYYSGLMSTADEMTDRIVNPHFAVPADTHGWQGNITVNEHVAEVFNTGFSISQTVGNLAPGYYLIYFQGYYRNGSQADARQRNTDGSEELLAEFVSNDMVKPVVSLMGERHSGYWFDAPNSMAEANAVFSQSPDNYANYLIAVVGFDGNLSIKFKKDRVCETDWFCFDNVRLFKIPTSVSGIGSVSDDSHEFSPEAVIYDLYGRRIGSFAGFHRLSPGIYIVRENGVAVKMRR